MHAEMAKIARTIKIRDKLRVRLFANQHRMCKLTQPLDPKIGGPLIATMTSS